MRATLADLARGFDEVDAVVVVLFDAGGDREDVRIEDDVFRREADAHQQLVAALADFDLAGERVGLALFVERHDDHGRAVGHDLARMREERLFAFLERDGIHDALALDALEARFDDGPLRRIDHDRHARDVGLGGDQIQETHHGGFRIEHALVHVHVDDLRAVLHLLARDGERGRIVVGFDELAELGRARDVGAFAHVHEADVVREVEGFEPGQLEARHVLFLRAHRLALHAIGNRLDVRRRRAAAAADEIEMSRVRELAEHLGGVLGRFVVFTEGIGQAGVRIHTHVRIGEARQLFDVGPQLFDAERAVQADRDGARVAHRRPERLHRLARERAPRSIGDRAGDDDGQIDALFVERVAHRVDRRFRVQRVEDGFDEDGIRAAIDEAARGIAVGGHELVERDRAVTRIVDVG